MIHTIKLQGYTATDTQSSGKLFLGSRGSYGIEQLQLIFGKEWQGMTVTATFHPPGTSMHPIRVLVGTDGIINVPPEATARTSLTVPGRIVFSGLDKGVQLISCDMYYTVADHATVEGAESTATPSLLEQMIVQSGSDRILAQKAAALASENAQNTAALAIEVKSYAAAAQNSEKKSLEFLNKSKTFATQAAAGAAMSNYIFGPDENGKFSLFYKSTI